MLHVAEGYGNSCDGAQLLNNDIGPSGHAPSGWQQFKKRDSTGTYTPGQWVSCFGAVSVRAPWLTGAYPGRRDLACVQEQSCAGEHYY